MDASDARHGGGASIGRGRPGRSIYPAGFEALAAKHERPLHPPGRDIRCIVSVGMLTEGWDANTVTHVVGLRPFMSQLLCEQVVGRALRRASYDVDEETGLFREEVAQVLGVPFEIIPFKASGTEPVEPSRGIECSRCRNVRNSPYAFRASKGTPGR